VGDGPAVFVAVGTNVSVAVGTGVAAAAQGGLEKVLLSNVTAPFCAKARPSKLAPVSMLMDADASILPINDVLVPSVAELPTRHHTLQGFPPTTLALPVVVRELADLKIQTPAPLSVSAPDNAKESAQ